MTLHIYSSIAVNPVYLRCHRVIFKEFCTSHDFISMPRQVWTYECKRATMPPSLVSSLRMILRTVLHDFRANISQYECFVLCSAECTREFLSVIKFSPKIKDPRHLTGIRAHAMVYADGQVLTAHCIKKDDNDRFHFDAHFSFGVPATHTARD